MEINKRVCYGLIVTLAVILVSSAQYDDFSDIRGPYCQNTRCCNGREDSCAVPILEECTKDVCLIDPEIINTVNDDVTRGWTASNYSEFWGRTLDDGVKLRLGTLQPQRIVMRMNAVRRIYDRDALPREFDAEQKWPEYIAGIQDQGWCGSSWAISTAAVASDRYAIVSRGLENVQLSPQNLLSCNTKGQQGCNGGHLDKAWLFVKKIGLVDEDCFSYTGRTEKCFIKTKQTLLESGCKEPFYSERVNRYTVGPAYRLGNETDIMYEITRSGPVQGPRCRKSEFCATAQFQVEKCIAHTSDTISGGW
ncbi:hypothetical protein NQ318_010029 [Aromia moschata]|uniref:Peptidase C1A papain C-terminal domain-containing protein n=1 Tax=Aromia moschata TaxID=1265417 RepID=A0AAV8YBX5_9CUCU|nr:hypothetical protein NQ318_010029 [Aromia moschata]